MLGPNQSDSDDLTFQILTVPSFARDASRRPSGLKTTLNTGPLWPRRTIKSCPVRASPIQMLFSVRPTASLWPSELNATEFGCGENDLENKLLGWSASRHTCSLPRE